MRPERVAPAELGALIETQIADLERYRQVVEAQDAVLRMPDASLLGAFTDEADEIVTGVITREHQIRRLRARLARDGSPEWLEELEDAMQLARRQAASAAARQALRIKSEAAALSRRLASVEAEMRHLAGGYQPARPAVSNPVLLDRVG